MTKEKKEEILFSCISDKSIAFRNIKIGFIKTHSIDLILKYLILLVNSIGHKEKGLYTIFVDEVNNKNMSRNLYNTFSRAEFKGRICKYMSFYSFQNRKNHIKLGFIYPIAMLIRTAFFSVRILFDILISKNTTKLVMRWLIEAMDKYMKQIGNSECYYIMTDHNFYSTIIAMKEECYSRVIQHGLVLNKKLYYPIRANEFCAWGIHSKQLLENDSKVTITGTYKFDNMKNKSSLVKSDYKHVLYCISILDNKLVQKKIDELLKICSAYNLILSIKLHPGSFYKLQDWEKKYKNLKFYKNEELKQIIFDVAISENSTINLDLSVLGKPFIIYDNNLGYFDRYLDLIPHATDYDGLKEVFKELDDYDFVKINNCMLREELNDGLCSIF